MNYCIFKYDDGVCGIFEDRHHLPGTARSLHEFKPDLTVESEDVELDPEGKLVFSRDFEKGEIVTIPVEFMGKFLEQGMPDAWIRRS